MPTTDQLLKKHVVFKVPNSHALPGTVHKVEAIGIWIQLSTGTLPEGSESAVKMKFPVIFVPYAQMEWLITELGANEILGH